jgi:heptosyltransferase-1
MARGIAAAGGAGVAPAPPTDLLGLLAVLRRASVVVGGDTGPLHLAAALGRPCVGLYAPPPHSLNGAARTGPYGAGHRVVQSADGTMGGIEVAPVVAATLALVRQ